MRVKNHSKLLIVCSLLLAIFLFAACTTGNTPVEGTQQAAPTNASSQGSAPQSPEEWRAYIVSAFRASNEQSWRYESDTVIGGEIGDQTTIEYEPPDRYHITGQPDVDIIIVGNQVFAKQNQIWVLLNVPAASVIDPDSLNRLEKTMRYVQCSGPETVNGKAMYVCQYTHLAKVGSSENEVQSKLWIDSTTNLPYQLITDGLVASMRVETGEIQTQQATRSIIYTYDPTIKIFAPQLPQ